MRTSESHRNNREMASFVCVTQSLKSLAQTNSVWKLQSSLVARVKATALQTQKGASPVRGVEIRGAEGHLVKTWGGSRQRV